MNPSRAWVKLVLFSLAMRVGQALAADPTSGEPASVPSTTPATPAAAAPAFLGSLDAASDWSVSVDAMFLDRSSSKGPWLLGVDFSGDLLLTSTDLSPSTSTGSRVSVVHNCSDKWGIEGIFFGVDGWSATADFPADSEVYYDLHVDRLGGPFVNEANFRYTSRLYSEECNLRYKYTDRITGLIGFRALQFCERYRVTGTLDFFGEDEDFSTGPYTQGIDVSNHLFGGQVGAEIKVGQWSRFSLSCVFKAGVYGNTASQQSFFDAPGTFGYLEAADRNTRVAFVGEIGINGAFQVTNHLAVRGGFNMLWLDSVALATMQIENEDLNAGTAAIDTTGAVFFHGANVGLEVTW